MILNFFYLFQLPIFYTISLIVKTLYQMYSTECHQICSLWTLRKLSFLSLVFHYSRNSKVPPFIYLMISHVLTAVDSARNLGVIFDNNLTFSQHISAISKSCFHDIRDLRRVRNTIDLTTAWCTIAISHSFLSWLLQLSITQSSYYSN